MHYQRKMRSGHMDSKKSLAWRLENKVDRIPFSGCWLWRGFVNRYGYGRISVGNKEEQAHRAAYEFFIGPIPLGKFVLHRCDVRSCCNPAHLFVGDHQSNMDDMVNKGRSLIGKKNPRARLTEDLVKQIRAGGVSVKEWARKLEVAESTIKWVRSGGTWRHV